MHSGESYESGLAKLHLVVTMLRRCHRAFVHAKDDPRLLDDLCRILVTPVCYRFCWIGYVDNISPNHIRPVACHGEEGPDKIDAPNSWEESGLGSAELVKTVLETNAPFRIQHLSAKESPASGETWQMAAVKKGFQSVLFLPLLSDESHPAIGIMALYSVEPAGFTDDETFLLNLLSRDIAKSIQSLSRKEGHPVSVTRQDSIANKPDDTIGLQDAALFFDH
jgi:hypothetical protein